MKKIFFTAAMALMVSGAAMADNAAMNEVTTVDYSFEINANSMSRYLGLSDNQKDLMEYVAYRLDNDLRRAKAAKSDEKRAERMRDAIVYNLSAAHSVLNDEQYHKYLIMLNTTLKNKGLNNSFGNTLANL